MSEDDGDWLAGIRETLPSEHRQLEEKLAGANAVNEQLRATIDVMTNAMTKRQERISYDLGLSLRTLASERAEVARLNERLAKSVDQFKLLRAERDRALDDLGKALAERDAALAARDRALHVAETVSRQLLVLPVAEPAEPAAAAEPVDIARIMWTPGA